jgi:hypothetical protein
VNIPPDSAVILVVRVGQLDDGRCLAQITQWHLRHQLGFLRFDPTPASRREPSGQVLEPVASAH